MCRRKEEQFSAVSQTRTQDSDRAITAVSLGESGKEFHVDGALQVNERSS